MSRHLIEQTQGRWRGILLTLGIADTFLTGKHGPCPMCGGKDRFRFDDKDGSGSWICSGCPDRQSGFGIHLVQGVLGLEIGPALERVEHALGGVAQNLPHNQVIKATVGKTPEPSTSQKARHIWAEAVAIKPKSIPAGYLSKRGIVLTSSPTTLRFHSRLLYLDEDGNFHGRLPAMLGLIQEPDGTACGVHRTFLSGSTLEQAPVPSPKKIRGSLADGAAVRLAKHDDVLGIAEGIETAFSASQLFNVPVWAALTAGGLEKWVPPAGVKEVRIFGDNDFSFTGQAAAFMLARRLKSQGFKVAVRIPQEAGTDWNDLIRSWK